MQLQEKPAQDKSTIETIGGWLAVVGGTLVALGVVTLLGLSLLSGIDVRQFFNLIALREMDPAIILVAVPALASIVTGSPPLVVGDILYVVAQSWSPERARRNHGSHRSVVATLVLAVIAASILASPLIFLAPLFGGGDVARGMGAIPAPVLWSALVIQDLILVGVVYLRVARPKVITWQDMGLTAEKLAGKVGAGVAGGIAILAVTIALQSLLQRLGLPEVQQDQLRPFVEGGIIGAVLLVLITVVGAPIAEEIFFRGYVFRAYAGQKGLLQAFFYSSILFAVLHVNPQAPFFGVQIIFPVTVMGLLLAAIVHRTGSVISTIVAHALNNAVATAALLGWLGKV